MDKEGRWVESGIHDSRMLWQLLVKITNKPLSKLIGWVSCENHKRTWQRVSNVFLHYIYY